MTWNVLDIYSSVFAWFTTMHSGKKDRFSFKKSKNQFVTMKVVRNEFIVFYMMTWNILDIHTSVFQGMRACTGVQKFRFLFKNSKNKVFSMKVV